MLEQALDTAIDDQTFRSDDLEFTFAARVSLPRFERERINFTYPCYRHGQTACHLATLSLTGTASNAYNSTLLPDSPRQ